MQYKDLINIYEQLDETSKRLEKTSIISGLIKDTKEEDLDKTVLLIQGRIFPKWDETKIGVAAKLVLKAISISTGKSASKIEERWSKKGDLGIVAEEFTKDKQQSTLFSDDLTVKKVFENLRKLPLQEGSGSVERKIKLIAELLTSAKPEEARYIVRTVLEDLRVGVGDGSIRDAIVWAFFGDKLDIDYNKEKNDLEMDEEERKEYNKYLAIVENANELKNDWGEVAKIAKKQGIRGLEKLKLNPGTPIKVMLYQKAENIDDAFERVGKPAALEYKYDGFRLQIHRSGKDIRLFTRRFDNVTSQFPDVVELVEKNIRSDSYVLDTEIIGIDPRTHSWLAFQQISQRIKRKYDIQKLVKEVPVMVNIFDAMSIDGRNLLKKPFKERRKAIENIVASKETIMPAKQLITENKEKAEKFYKESLDKGNEGIMMKNLESPYKPGSRVGHGVKVKPVMETLDLVITAAEWGEGKRASWLSSFTIACRKDDNFLDIGKVGTGIKEKEDLGVSFTELTKMLKPLITEEHGKTVKVKPKIVIEINYEEIQKSTKYGSGFALRFPRLIRLRDDKPASEASTIKQVERYYHEQRHRND